MQPVDSPWRDCALGFCAKGASGIRTAWLQGAVGTAGHDHCRLRRADRRHGRRTRCSGDNSSGGSIVSAAAAESAIGARFGYGHAHSCGVQPRRQFRHWRSCWTLALPNPEGWDPTGVMASAPLLDERCAFPRLALRMFRRSSLAFDRERNKLGR